MFAPASSYVSLALVILPPISLSLSPTPTLTGNTVLLFERFRFLPPGPFPNGTCNRNQRLHGCFLETYMSKRRTSH